MILEDVGNLAPEEPEPGKLKAPKRWPKGMRLGRTPADWGHTRSQYPWPKMRVGQCLTIYSGRDDYRKAWRAAYKYGQPRGWRFRIGWDPINRIGRIELIEQPDTPRPPTRQRQ